MSLTFDQTNKFHDRTKEIQTQVANDYKLRAEQAKSPSFDSVHAGAQARDLATNAFNDFKARLNEAFPESDYKRMIAIFASSLESQFSTRNGLYGELRAILNSN